MKSNLNCLDVSELPCLPFFATSFAGQIKLLYFHTGQVYLCVCSHRKYVSIKDVTAAPCICLLCVECAQSQK